MVIRIYTISGLGIPSALFDILLSSFTFVSLSFMHNHIAHWGNDTIKPRYICKNLQHINTKCGAPTSNFKKELYMAELEKNKSYLSFTLNCVRTLYWCRMEMLNCSYSLYKRDNVLIYLTIHNRY